MEFEYIIGVSSWPAGSMHLKVPLTSENDIESKHYHLLKFANYLHFIPNLRKNGAFPFKNKCCWTEVGYRHIQNIKKVGILVRRALYIYCTKGSQFRTERMNCVPNMRLEPALLLEYT